MPRAKTVSRRNMPPLNRSINPNSEPGILLEELRQPVGIDSRSRDVSAKPVHGQ